MANFVWPALIALLAISVRSVAEPAETELKRINRALRDWMALMEDERPYAVFDGENQLLQLYHGRALMRSCKVTRGEAGPGWPVSARLDGHVRGDRPSHPWSVLQDGPFDWEQNLVSEATDASALHFSNGMLVYASEGWGSPRPPALKLGSRDLRALYNALEIGTNILLLPAGWNREYRGERYGVKPWVSGH